MYDYLRNLECVSSNGFNVIIYNVCSSFNVGREYYSDKTCKFEFLPTKWRPKFVFLSLA